VISSLTSLDNRNLPRAQVRHQNSAMRIPAKVMIAAALCWRNLCFSQAPELRSYGQPKAVVENVRDRQEPDHLLGDDDRLSLLAAALDARVRRSSEHDCSHLVHAIYERAGFPYAYAPSSELYAGVDGFQRVKQPEPGDLVVWRGHAGIVIKPSQHIFFSYMRSGPGIDDYQAPYWKTRGHARFYRYVKNDSCAACGSPQRSRQLVKIKR
jgi:hypothetical protein